MCLNHVPCSKSLPTPLLNVMPMGNKPRVNHRLLPHTTMSMRDKSVIDESHPMIILKAKVICSLNQNFWMSYSNDHFFYKTKCLRLRTPSYTFTGFHRWKRITTYTGSFTGGGIYPYFLLPDTYFPMLCNRTTLLDIV